MNKVPVDLKVFGDDNSSTVTKCKKKIHYSENLYYSLKCVNTLNVKIMIHEDGSELGFQRHASNLLSPRNSN